MKWRRPHTDFPDRRHAAAVANLFKAKREESKREADRLWEEFIEDAPKVKP